MTVFPVFSRQIAVLWLACVCLLFMLALYQGIRFDSSIISLLPKSDQQLLAKQASDQVSQSFSNRLLILLSGSDESRVRQSVVQMADQLKSLSGIKDITWKVSAESSEQLQKELFPFRFALLDETSRQALTEGKYSLFKQKALQHLYSPISITQGSLVDDPFSLYTDLLLSRSSSLNIHLERQLLKLNQSDLPTYLLILTFDGDAFSVSLQNQVLDTIDKSIDGLSEQGIHTQLSGLILHAAAGARQASHEISTIGLGSLLGVILLMLVVFRRGKPLLLVTLPIGIAFICATAVTSLVFHKVHLITLAFGTGLIGVSIDYSLHYLCERNTLSGSQASASALRKVFPGLLLGLFSSIAAYGVLSIAPFPGLQQMSLFSVAGLVAAWLTVIVLFPILTNRDPARPIDRGGFLKSLAIGSSPRLGVMGTVIGLLLLIFAGFSLTSSRYQDDVRLLQTSPASLLAQEQKVQTLLGSYSSSQFMLLHCAELEACLKKEEGLSVALSQLKNEGVIQGFQAVSQQLPSLKKQQENLNLVQNLYQQQLKPLYQQLKLPESRYQQSFTRMKMANQPLTFEVWKNLKSSEGWRELILQHPGGYASMVRFSGVIKEDARLALQQLAGQSEEIEFVDRIDSISLLLKEYREKVMDWLLLAYILVLIVLTLRYRWQVLRVIAPPLFASIIALAIVAGLEQGVNLFHIMALVLVLGIGLDMGIFLQESGNAPQTWQAVSLSCVTSLLAFGLLSLSQTPVLYHFGLIVLIGLSLTWILAIIFSNYYSGNTLNDTASGDC